MSSKLRAFQQAAVRAACLTLRSEEGPRRFLIADEVGLGKTMVARDIVKQLSDGRTKPLIVYYVANGHRVANQNRGRLVDFLPEKDAKQAISRVDRIGLIPMQPRSQTQVTLYALTPGTSFPGQKARLYGGRKEERAFIAALLGRAYPYLIRRLPDGLLRQSVKLNWETLLEKYRREVSIVSKRLVAAFRLALRTEFTGDPRSKLMTATENQSPGRVIGRMRRALAHAVLLSDPPDLIIFDEFQRYRYMVSPEGLADRLVSALLSPPRRRSPAVLLLSATPYKLYASRWEESRGAEAHHELFELVEFLGGIAGKTIREDAERVFGEFGESIRKIAVTSSTADCFAGIVAEAQEQRQVLHDLLSPLMSRTERATATLGDSDTESLCCELSPRDVYAFRHLVKSFSPQHRNDAIAYWLSVPLPAQALGSRYQAWRQANFRRDSRLTKLTLQSRNHLGPSENWPHPKLRELRSVTPSDSLALPWVPPSLPWWPLSGAWAGAAPHPKLLLFSRFKATPQSIAALTSFAVETAYLNGDASGYQRVWRRRRLQPGPGRLPVLALFHPSVFLIRAVDPLRAASQNFQTVRASVRRQLLDAFNQLDISVRKKTAKDRERRRPTWSLISALDHKGGFRPLSQAAWTRIGASDSRVRGMVAQWHQAPKLEWISPRELDDLVTMAIAAPGVVAGRALTRHYTHALSNRSYDDLVRLCWSGLRPYLDNPIFWARLKGHTPTETILRAVVAGGLESLLDEHFWILNQSSSKAGSDIAGALFEALSITTGSFSFHPVGPKSKQRIRIRCHVAVPFGGTEQEPQASTGPDAGRPARSDELRKAFNAPFWPYVLATTSVGQEGLDFHTWCSRVAHWDLCSSPLDLEQREGRIQRFAGLLVRRSLAESIGPNLLNRPDYSAASRWTELAEIADREHSDPSGLSPWWVLPKTGVTRYIFELPQGRDAARFAKLREQRFVYRLALGQPNQEDFVDALTRTDNQNLKVLQELALDLSAFNRSSYELVPSSIVPNASSGCHGGVPVLE